MGVEIKVPSVGESITEGTIARWLKKDGAAVQQDEPIFELETEKATQEVPAPGPGILHIKVREGQTVRIGAVVGMIDAASEARAEAKSSSKPAKGETAKAEPAKPEGAKTAPAKKELAREDGKAAPVSPAARRLAAEEEINVQQIVGSGRGGVILKGDVQEQMNRKPDETTEQARPAEKATTEKPRSERETRQPMSAIRQRIAERLLAAQKSTASLTTFNEADMSAILELRSRFKDRFKEKHGVSLGFMPFFIRACIDALKAYPLVNAYIDERDVVLQNYFNIGVAVSTDRGLMAPVLHDADRMSFAEIEQQIAALAGKARAGKISLSDLQGGTFTITNGGIFGSMMSTPILNPPQSAILGMHAIQKRPVVRDDQIVSRPMMYLALTYDHRLIDGREAVLFLVHIKEFLENPGRALLDL